MPALRPEVGRRGASSERVAQREAEPRAPGLEITRLIPTPGRDPPAVAQLERHLCEETNPGAIGVRHVGHLDDGAHAETLTHEIEARVAPAAERLHRLEPE